MTQVSRGEKLRSGFVKKQNAGGSTLLAAAVSLLGVSLGVTPAQSGVEITAADGSSARESNTQIAATRVNTTTPRITPHIQSNQEKQSPGGTKALLPAVQSNQKKLMLNPQPLPPSPPTPRGE